MYNTLPSYLSRAAMARLEEESSGGGHAEAERRRRDVPPGWAEELQVWRRTTWLPHVKASREHFEKRRDQQVGPGVTYGSLLDELDQEPDKRKKKTDKATGASTKTQEERKQEWLQKRKRQRVRQQQFWKPLLAKKTRKKWVPKSSLQAVQATSTAAEVDAPFQPTRAFDDNWDQDQ